MLALAHPSRFSAARLISDDERRDCPRIPVQRLTLFANGVAHEGFGDVSVGGALWMGAPLDFLAANVELSIELDDAGGSLRAAAEVLSLQFDDQGQVVMHLRFVDLPFEDERRIARHVDECMLLVGRVARAA